MTRDVFATVLNALSNASSVPVGRRDVVAILATGDGPGHLVRALFGDCSLETLDRLGESAGVSPAQIRVAYGAARDHHAAANPDFE